MTSTKLVRSKPGENRSSTSVDRAERGVRPEPHAVGECMEDLPFEVRSWVRGRDLGDGCSARDPGSRCRAHRCRRPRTPAQPRARTTPGHRAWCAGRCPARRGPRRSRRRHGRGGVPCGVRRVDLEPHRVGGVARGEAHVMEEGAHVEAVGVRLQSEPLPVQCLPNRKTRREWWNSRSFSASRTVTRWRRPRGGSRGWQRRQSPAIDLGDAVGWRRRRRRPVAARPLGADAGLVSCVPNALTRCASNSRTPAATPARSRRRTGARRRCRRADRLPPVSSITSRTSVPGWPQSSSSACRV